MVKSLCGQWFSALLGVYPRRVKVARSCDSLSKCKPVFGGLIILHSH